MSTSKQGNPPSRPTLSSSGHSELTIEGGRALSQLEQSATLGRISSKNRIIPSITQGLAAVQLGPANLLNPLGHHVFGYATSESDVMSVSSEKSSRFRFRRRLSALFKGDRKAKDTAPIEPSTQLHIRTGNCVRSAERDVEFLTVASGLASPAQPDDVATTIVVVPTIKVKECNAIPSSLPLDIFSKNVSPATLTAPLPQPRARIDETTQLVYGYQLLSMGQPYSPDPNTDELQDIPLNNTQQEWVDLIDPIEQDRLHWIVEKLVRAFVEDDLKGSAAIGEIVLLGPILDREMYRTLLNCFISQFEQDKLLDITLLHGLVQLVECASDGYLVDDDLARIATVLFKKLSMTHNGTSDHVLLLTLALDRLLDVMVAGKVKDLNRDRDHQPMLQLLDGLKGSDNAYVKYQATYAYQALQYVPDDETPLQVVWRYSKMAAAGASAVSSVFKLDPAGLLQGLESLQEIGASVIGVAKARFDGYQPLREGTGTAVRMTEDKFAYMKKRSWYLTLQVTALFIRQGRLSDFKQVVIQAPCRHDVNFQWGVCRQLGEIAVYQLWDDQVRAQAIDFLGALYKDNTCWKPHEDVKRWILTILQQGLSQSDALTQNRALTMLNELRNFGATEFPGTFPLNARLPLPAYFPLLIRVQEIPKVEYELRRLRMQRIDEYKQAVYIAPMAKPSLQAPDESVFPLMDKIEKFLAGDGQVMLILGDSGAGKSTFNRYLEYLLWQRYQTGGRIPLLINLPAINQADQELVAEHLKRADFPEDQIRELKHHRQLLLICDGYDESQLTSNLHTTNNFNQSRQWDVKLLITCRTQYLGPDYRDRFVPKAPAQYHGSANDLFLEAIIAPFSKAQIELYVEKYVPLEPRTWVKKDYMDKLTAIPNLMDLVKNPFLLTLALEALPKVVEGKTDLSKLRVTRVELYDTFAKHWLSVNKRRLQDLKLKDEKLEALEDLLSDGFEQNGIEFQKKLAAAIFREQEGRPVVEYSQRRDKLTWKREFFSTEADVILLREASLLGRAGNQYRFIHRSILEYFFSCAVWDTTRSDDEFDPHAYLASVDRTLSIADHLLSMRNLVSEPSIILFLVERVQAQPNFKEHLLALVDLSKSETQASQAAANAITILVRSGQRFNGTDLQRIRIPGADVTGGRFDSAQLQDSNLTGVNLTKAWIRQANFSRAQMEGVRFGELPYLNEDSSIWSCALSPDGNTFAAGLDTGDISMYDTATWTKTRTFQGHKSRIYGLCFSPSGLHLLSGSHDRTARLWSSETESTEYILEGHEMSVSVVAYSPCGKQVASASYMKVRLWDAETGAVLFVLEDHTDSVIGVAYSPNGTNIISCGGDGTIRMFDTHNGQYLLSSRGTGVRHSCVAYSPDGQRVVVGSEEGRLQLWKTAGMDLEIEWDGHNDCVYSVQFSPDGQWILSSSDDYTVRVWDAQTSAILSAFTGHSSSVTGAVFLPSTMYVVSTSPDKTVRLWEASYNVSGSTADDYFGYREIAAYSPDGQFLVSESHLNIIQQYDADAGEPSLALRLEESHVRSAAYSPTGLQIATGGQEGKVTLWNTQSGAVEHVLCGHSEAVRMLAYSPRGQWLASGSDDRTARVWDAYSGTSAYIFAEDFLVQCLAFSWNGFDLAVGGRSKISVYDLSTGNRKTVIKSGGPVKPRVVYPPGSSQVACCYAKDGEGVRLYGEEGNTFRTILRHEGLKVKRFAYSSCGQWIAAVGVYNVHLWKSGSNELEQDWTHMATVEGLFNDVIEIAWRPNMPEFATASQDGSLRVWKVIVESSKETDKVTVQLVWSSGVTSLTVQDAVIEGAVGLDTNNRKLLEQRGAICDSASVDEGVQTFQESNYEKQ